MQIGCVYQRWPIGDLVISNVEFVFMLASHLYSLKEPDSHTLIFVRLLFFSEVIKDVPKNTYYMVLSDLFI